MEATLYRPNAGIIIFNKEGKLLWCKERVEMDGNFLKGELMMEELRKMLSTEAYEEVGLGKDKIKIIKENEKWIKYDIPKEKIPKCFSFKKQKI